MPLLDKSAFTDPTLPIPSWAGVKSAVRGLMGAVTPPDPYEEAGRMVQQARGGDYLGALETGFGAMPTTGAIKAYHGSPHSFDRFDLSKIGTGEGAQAYGHGLYFADNEAVAKAYRDQLASGTMKTPSGALFDPTNELSHMNVRVAARKGGIDAAIARANEILSGDAPEATLAMARRDLNVLENLKARGGAEPNPGHMYEVNINAEPEHFLDWDKPLSEQAPHVQGVFSNIGAKVNPSETPLERAGRIRMPDGSLLSQNETSMVLREAGIPGIKYLDQGSRGAGEGSRNYVVFDDKLIDIARKYGLLPLGMGGFDFSQNEQK